jgi:hypothetical protein
VHQGCSFVRPRKADDVGDTWAGKKLTKSMHVDSREASGSSGGMVRAVAYVGKPPPAVLGAEATRARAVGERAASGEDMQWLEVRREGQLAKLG